ncbi:MAG: NAD-binding protein, partial [Spirochaetota bacterium]
MTPRLVLFGAGNIGRSFIGQIFARGGYEVVFVDIDARLVRELNRRGRYEVIIAHPDGRESTLPVEGVRAVDANDREAVEHELVDASIAATAERT